MLEKGGVVAMVRATVIVLTSIGKSMKKPSQPIQPRKKCEKPNPESEMDRLARQWCELIFEQLQHQKYMSKKQEWKLTRAI